MVHIKCGKTNGLQSTFAEMLIKLCSLRKSSLVLLLLLCVVLFRVTEVAGLKCYCDPRECDYIGLDDCPGKGIIIKDPCKCCDVCSKTEGEACGGPGDFSGTCEPSLDCVSRLPVDEPGVCTDLRQLIHSASHSCGEEGARVEMAAGCVIANKRCKCFNKSYHCSNSLHHTWDFQNLLECHLNLKVLLKVEMEFDEDFKVSANLYDVMLGRRSRRRRKRRSPFQGIKKTPALSDSSELQYKNSNKKR